MSERVKIAMIDTGTIDPNAKGIQFSMFKGRIIESSQIKDDIGHGAGIYNIIKKHCKADLSESALYFFWSILFLNTSK